LKSVCHIREVLIVFTLVAGVSSQGSAGSALQGTTGSVTGRITVSRSDGLFEEIMRERERNRYGDHAHSLEEPQPYALSEKAVVYLISPAKGTRTPPPAKNPRLDQKDLMFRPLVLPIVAGTTVDFPNNDEVFHNVFSYSSPKEFDLGRYPIGKSKKVTFDQPGVVNVYCDIHAYMYATILVLDNPYFATPDEEGEFVIRGVPDGEYELIFWYGKKPVSSRMVTVKAGEASRVDLEY
jgi:plastocyanin